MDLPPLRRPRVVQLASPTALVSEQRPAVSQNAEFSFSVRVCLTVKENARKREGEWD